MRTRFDLRIAFRMARIIRRERYELLHAHTPRSVLIGRLAAALANVPVVYHVHSPTVRDSTRPLRNRVNHWIERISLANIRALIPVSHSLAQHMVQSGYSDQIVHTVPNGVPKSRSQRNSIPPSSTWTFGMVALFRPRKGLEVLLDALALLKLKSHRVCLLAIGPFETPRYEAEILARVRELGLQDSIEWTGFTSDVQSQLRRLDALILPSLFGEGLPMVVLEAMAAGVPVVASNTEGVPEVITDRVNGLLSQPGDPKDLARCMQMLVDKEIDWQQLRDNASKTHADCFSDDVMAERVARIYRQLL
jgi:glycosyltransferase involved in cell wall biosynthesis